jgi:hypothetical protein
MNEPQTLFGYNSLKDDLQELRSFVSSEFLRVFQFLLQLEKVRMASVKEILEAVNTTGLLLAENNAAIAEISVGVLAIVTRLRQGQDVSPEELQQVFDQLTNQKELLTQQKDTLTQIIPSISSPTAPSTDPTEPLPTPTEPIPTEPGDISVTTSEPGTGLDGSVEIDVNV